MEVLDNPSSKSLIFWYYNLVIQINALWESGVIKESKFGYMWNPSSLFSCADNADYSQKKLPAYR